MGRLPQLKQLNKLIGYWILDITSTVSVPGPLRRISFIQQSNIFGLDYYLLISIGITPVCMLVDISGTKSWVSS